MFRTAGSKVDNFEFALSCAKVRTRTNCEAKKIPDNFYPVEKQVPCRETQLNSDIDTRNTSVPFKQFRVDYNIIQS